MSQNGKSKNRTHNYLRCRYTKEQNQFFGNKVLNKSCSSTSFGEQKICTRTTFIYCFVPEKLVLFLSCSGTFRINVKVPLHVDEQNQFFGNLQVLNKSCSSTSFGEQKIVLYKFFGFTVLFKFKNWFCSCRVHMKLNLLTFNFLDKVDRKTKCLFDNL